MFRGLDENAEKHVHMNGHLKCPMSIFSAPIRVHSAVGGQSVQSSRESVFGIV